MIQKFKDDVNRVEFRLGLIGAEIVGLAAVPEAVVSRQIFKAVFWKSLSKLERVETALEVYDYAKNLKETISDPLVRDKTVYDAVPRRSWKPTSINSSPTRFTTRLRRSTSSRRGPNRRRSRPRRPRGRSRRRPRG